MKIRNIAFIAALIGWIALAVYYVSPTETAVAKENSNRVQDSRRNVKRYCSRLQA